MNTPRILLFLLLTAGTTRAQAQDNPAPAPATEPAPTEMQKWIAATDAQWQAVFKRDVTDVHEAELAKLKLQYLTSLETAIAKASGAGDLDGALELRNEQKRFGDTNVFPGQDEEPEAASVKQRRAAIRMELERVEKESVARAKPLHANYDQVLAKAQTQLTQRGRLDDAVMVKAKRAEIAAAWLAGIPAAPAPAAVAEQPKPQVPAPDPELAAISAAATAGRNLFKNPNFENGTHGWELAGFSKKGTMAVDPKELHNGKPTLRLESTEGEHMFARQPVPIKPNTCYRLSGFIKTKDVEPVKKGSKAGACLMVGFEPESTPAIVKTKAWTRVTVDIGPKVKPELNIGASLGGYGGPMTGTAWFSELSLVELGQKGKK